MLEKVDLGSVVFNTCPVRHFDFILNSRCLSTLYSEILAELNLNGLFACIEREMPLKLGN